MYVECSLHDCWLDAQLQPGDTVNLLADLVEQDGVLRATCDYRSGAAALLSAALVKQLCSCGVAAGAPQYRA